MGQQFDRGHRTRLEGFAAEQNEVIGFDIELGRQGQVDDHGPVHHTRLLLGTAHVLCADRQCQTQQLVESNWSR